MSNLDPGKLHVRYLANTYPTEPLTPRRYTLTHSDLTGDLFLAIGRDYDHKAISGFYTRIMRDEVLAEWLNNQTLHVYCHVSGGFVFGMAGWRDEIFRYHLPQVLQALYYGDRELFQAHPALDLAPAKVHFRASQSRYHRVEDWGPIREYGIFQESYSS